MQKKYIILVGCERSEFKIFSREDRKQSALLRWS